MLFYHFETRHKVEIPGHHLGITWACQKSFRLSCLGIPRQWKPAIGEKFHAEQELDNAVDKFAVKVVKNNETVRHLPCDFVVFHCTLRKDMRGSDWP